MEGAGETMSAQTTERVRGHLDSTVETGPVGPGGNGRGMPLVEYQVKVTIEGVAPILFHRYDIMSVERKAVAKKGSETKKTDDVESYVYRTPGGHLGVPGLSVKAAIVEAAKSDSDPRSKRKSARDLIRASLVIDEEVCDLGRKDWDYLDRRPVTVQMARVVRDRPALQAGWKFTFTAHVLQPEFLDEDWLYRLIQRAGSFCGLCDFRPDFGRFRIVAFNRLIVTS